MCILFSFETYKAHVFRGSNKVDAITSSHDNGMINWWHITIMIIILVTDSYLKFIPQYKFNYFIFVFMY